MNSTSVIYAMYWQVDFAPEYKWTKCGKCFNTKTGNQIKQVYKSRCIGYYIRGKFHSLSSIRQKLSKITHEEIPF